ncbi:TSC22 domain family protein 1 [Brachionichthys hirsutus]|uniref:TSC22 domain family protein 1 n=1 Tax=Brachionichthys hirsutus TaxID=412623 RepID=UPI003604448A
MHQQDFSGDPPGTGSRKAAFHYRAGSSGGSPASPAAGDDNPTQAGSSSPALHHQAASAQVKKKSGFQITSVTSAQINVSGNNSLADDTESYDDMDESHAEDLSSSDAPDVSAPRAADAGAPPRSSSDEALNSLHGVDSPGVASPNEPRHPHAIARGSQQHGAMVNGMQHHHHHHYCPQQHLHHSDGSGGGELSLAGSAPAAPSSQPQRDNNPAGGTNQPFAAGGAAVEPQPQGAANLSDASAVAPPPGPAGSDHTGSSGPVGPAGRGAGPSAAQSQHAPTQTVTGSRFRVVKLDTNSEPFRKGRWTCTEYYEKEAPPPAAAEAPRGAEGAAEAEGGPGQDFTSPQALQSPPQGPAQAVPPQEAVGGASPSVMSHQAVPQGGYPAPQPHSGVRQPDFIQPTAPFQTQVQPPPPHASVGVSVTPTPAQGGPPAPASFGQPQTRPAQQVQPSSAYGTPYVPLTADLVKSHLMYAVREEVEVLKEQIKELIERNAQLEQENNLLKNLASPEQMAQFQAQVQTGGSPTGAAQPPVGGPAGATQSSGPSA